MDQLDLFAFHDLIKNTSCIYFTRGVLYLFVQGMGLIPFGDSIIVKICDAVR